MFSGVGLFGFACICCAAVAGYFLGRSLPEAARSDASQKVLHSATGIVGILTALVLGLLVANSKANFDTTNGEFEQFAASLSLLDGDLARVGVESSALRAALRDFTAKKIAATWPSDSLRGPILDDYETDHRLDDLQERLRASAPQTDAGKEARASALALLTELKRTNRLIDVQENDRTDLPFRAVVIFWLCMLYLSYTLFAPLNRLTVASLVVSAFCVSIALNVINDMDRPLEGILKVSPLPMRQALEAMGK